MIDLKLIVHSILSEYALPGDGTHGPSTFSIEYVRAWKGK
jgi:hypothetical protein